MAGASRCSTPCGTRGEGSQRRRPARTPTRSRTHTRSFRTHMHMHSHRTRVGGGGRARAVTVRGAALGGRRASVRRAPEPLEIFQFFFRGGAAAPGAGNTVRAAGVCRLKDLNKLLRRRCTARLGTATGRSWWRRCWQQTRMRLLWMAPAARRTNSRLLAVVNKPPRSCTPP